MALAAVCAIVNASFYGRNKPSRLRHTSDSLLGTTASALQPVSGFSRSGNFLANLPSSKAAATLDSILWLFLLAVLANVAYCAAYIVDIFVQTSAFRDQWQQFRWLLFTLGVAFAAVLARYFSMGLFAAVGAATR